ncbi:translation initiation factor IF-2-like [Peromyscus leucopus]|uniref:translation initiation factor IF-2-like n=1 Tax=Peromyscus leucopus TaxID=10041 RepID=UPI0018858E08|nr:translation initiation factor IF-2-like [Peromyscus leucopus]
MCCRSGVEIMSFLHTVAEPKGPAITKAQAERAEKCRGAFTQDGRRGARPSRGLSECRSTSAPSPPIPAAPGHLTYTPSPGDPPTEAARRGPQPQTPPQACCNAHPNLQPPLPAAALPIGELRVEGAGLEAGQGSTQHAPAPPTASSGGRSSDWRTERGGRSWRRGGGRKFWKGLGAPRRAAGFH